MSELLFFDKMLTPKIIVGVYWIMLVASVVSGIGSMFGGYTGFTFSSFLWGLIYIVLGVVFTRIVCELLIVTFKMNEALQHIRNK